MNAIPSRASLTLEIRSINDNAREAFASYARDIANEDTDKYSTDFSFSQTYNQAAVLCDPSLRSRLKKIHQLHYWKDNYFTIWRNT